MIELGILDFIKEDEDFAEAFCCECEAIRTIPGWCSVYGEPIGQEEKTCPCDFDIGENLCVRQNDYMTIVEIVDELNAAIRDVCNG